MGLNEKYKETIDNLSSYHEEVSRSYSRLSNSGSYSDYYIDALPTPRNIINYLYEHGGGVSEAELRRAGGERFDEILKLLISGISPTVLEMKVTDYRGMIDSYYAALAMKLFSKYANTSLPYEILKPAVHKEPNGTYFLTCQKKGDAYAVDLLARMGDVSSAINNAERIIAQSEDIASLRRAISTKEQEIESARAERKSLGLFKGSRGKQLKQQIETLESDISSLRGQTKQIEASEQELKNIEASLKALSS